MTSAALGPSVNTVSSRSMICRRPCGPVVILSPRKIGSPLTTSLPTSRTPGIAASCTSPLTAAATPARPAAGAACTICCASAWPAIRTLPRPAATAAVLNVSMFCPQSLAQQRPPILDPRSIADGGADPGAILEADGLRSPPIAPSVRVGRQPDLVVHRADQGLDAAAIGKQHSPKIGPHRLDQAAPFLPHAAHTHPPLCPPLPPP